MSGKTWDVIIIGGGAAGFFSAVNIKENFPDSKVLILEKDKEVLKKVKVSGGGRCNVTHNCTDPAELVKHYPRGNKELLGPFHRFGPEEMMQWLEYHGVETKTESDNRVFPESDDSQTIIDCFVQAAKELKVEVKLSASVTDFINKENQWHISTLTDKYVSKNLVITAGSSQRMWDMLHKVGHTIVPPVPSLFTFNIKHPVIRPLPGVSIPSAKIDILKTNFSAKGPLLITHWGLSGPAVLKLSAWAARELHQFNYQFSIRVNWVGRETKEISEELNQIKTTQSRKRIHSSPAFSIPRRLWNNLLIHSGIPEEINWADLSKNQLQVLSESLTALAFQVNGKSTFKEEFVTAGGVELSEINFKTFESKKVLNLYLAGEVLNIDGVTGGFNFQAAWTGAWIIAQSIRP